MLLPYAASHSAAACSGDMRVYLVSSSERSMSKIESPVMEEGVVRGVGSG
jgi:hypothetical protein